MRKLLWFALGWTAALAVGYAFLPEGWPLWLAAVVLLPAPAALLLRGRARARLLLPLAGAACGLLWLWGYTALFVTPAEKLVGEVRTLTLRVSSFPESGDGYTRLEAASMDAALPPIHLLLYDYDGGMTELRPGDVAEVPLKILSARTYYQARSDHYLALGVQLRGYCKGAYRVTGRWAWSWLYAPLHLAKKLSETALRCFPEDVAALMKALLTGDKTEYYLDDALSAAMRTTGFTHIIAISGTHVAFLVGLLRLVLKRRRALVPLGVLLILGFMAMTGFTPSVTRSGIIQLLLLLAQPLLREEDAPTSLAAALLAITLWNPYAVGSLSLQFSFAAMAGLLLLTPGIHDRLYPPEGDRKKPVPRTLWGRAAHGLWSTFAASVGASLFTLPLSALHFGYVPLYGILTNLLCLWAMSGAFLGGYGVCLLYLLWPGAGLACGWVLGWLPRYTMFVVERLARLPHALLYTRWNLGAWWLLSSYGLFAGGWLLRKRTRWWLLSPLCFSALSLLLLLLAVRPDLEGRMRVAAVDVGQGACFVALTERATVLIDCGSTGSADNAGDRAADYLLQNGRRYVDLLILTHFHADHVNGVKRLMARVDVDRLAYAEECADNAYAEDILALCAARGTETFPIRRDMRFTLEELALDVYAPLGVGDVNEMCLLTYGDYGDYEFLVTGDAGGDVERLLTVLHDLGDMELLAVGHHGSRTSTSAALLDAITPETAFISVGAGNSYGHPAPEVLERLEARGIRVCRTDLEGTVFETVAYTDEERTEN